MSYPTQEDSNNTNYNISVHIPLDEAQSSMGPYEPNPELRSQINAQLLRDGHIDRYAVSPVSILSTAESLAFHADLVLYDEAAVHDGCVTAGPSITIACCASYSEGQFTTVPRDEAESTSSYQTTYRQLTNTVASSKTSPTPSPPHPPTSPPRSANTHSTSSAPTPTAPPSPPSWHAS